MWFPNNYKNYNLNFLLLLIIFQKDVNIVWVIDIEYFLSQKINTRRLSLDSMPLK